MIDTDVVIAGAGPVGLTLAIYLARQKIGVTVLERDQTLNQSPRAMVYLHNLMKDLDEIGMLDGMRRIAHEDHDGFTMHLPAFDEVINIPMSALDDIDPYPYNLHLGQGEYCQVALDLLSELPHATVIFGAEVIDRTEDHTGITVRYLHEGSEKTVRAGWLVGADGGQSTVRKMIGGVLEGTTWGERFVATNVRFDFRSRGFNSSNMYVDAEIGCIVAQITPDGLWRCTYQEPESLPEETVHERIEAHFVRLLGEADAAKVKVVDFRPYRMHQRLSSTLRGGRLVLAGDAAHLTNPTGGLGLTTGLYDAMLLQEALVAVIRGGADASVLDAYAAERARVFLEVSSPNATNFKRLVYDSTDISALHTAVAPFRAASATLEGQRAFYTGVDLVRSPSVLPVN